MGQRLVLTIRNDDLEQKSNETDDYRDSKKVMKLYYHWSGYTAAAQEIMFELADVINKAKNNGEDIIRAILRYVQTEHKEETEYFNKQFPNLKYRCVGGPDGGKDGDEYKYIKKLYPDEPLEENPDRNYGLISMSDKGMEDAQMWSEGDCIMDISTGDCKNWIVFGYESFEDWANSWGYDEDKEELEQAKKRYDEAPVVDTDDGEEVLDFDMYNEDDIKRAKAVADKIFASNSGIFKDKSGRVYSICA